MRCIYCKNSWSNPEYKGVNTRWMTPDGQRFEVQFHTPESFHAKHEVTHQAYERIRNPVNSQDASDGDLRDFQREVSSWIPDSCSDWQKIQDIQEEGLLMPHKITYYAIIGDGSDTSIIHLDWSGGWNMTDGHRGRGAAKGF